MQNLLARNKMFANECIQTMPMHKERATMPELDPAERVESFAEVDQVISKQTAYDEASRCLRCYRLYSVVTEMDLPRELPATHNELSFAE